MPAPGLWEDHSLPWMGKKAGPGSLSLDILFLVTMCQSHVLVCMCVCVCVPLWMTLAKCPCLSVPRKQGQHNQGPQGEALSGALCRATRSPHGAKTHSTSNWAWRQILPWGPSLHSQSQPSSAVTEGWWRPHGLPHSRPLRPDPIAAPAPTPSQVPEMDGWRSLFAWPWPPTAHPPATLY